MAGRGRSARNAIVSHMLKCFEATSTRVSARLPRTSRLVPAIHLRPKSTKLAQTRAAPRDAPAGRRNNGKRPICMTAEITANQRRNKDERRKPIMRHAWGSAVATKTRKRLARYLKYSPFKRLAFSQESVLTVSAATG